MGVVKQDQLPLSVFARELIGDDEQRVQAGDIVLIPADRPHGFVNTGGVPLRQVDIHVSPRFVTDWLADEEPGV